MSRLLVPLLCALFGWCCAYTAEASENWRYRALLVGVSEYPALKGKDLRGPREDVARMSEQLVRRGFQSNEIVVLTETADRTRLPTRQRIMDELANLARTARPNDYIVIMMAGHGSRSPVPPGSPFQEPDGLFEIFLPRDVQGWQARPNGGDGDVVNSIKDHEIRALVDQMVTKGAFVWAIFDACHSATLVRSGDVVLRQVEPSDLGIPRARLAEAERRARSAPAAAPAPAPGPTVDHGRAAYFYAAQTTELAPEMPLPRELKGSPVHGLFSFSIVQALEAGVPMTYRQLSEYVLMQYSVTPEARSVTPAFSGGRGLDTPVLGAKARLVRQWPLVRDPVTYQTRPEIRAGSLSQVHPGAVFALFRSALHGSEQEVGRAVVTQADARGARLAMLDGKGSPSPLSPLPDGAEVARLVRSASSFELAIAVDTARCSSPCPFAEALRDLQQSGAPGLAARWVQAGQPADLLLRADGRRLWLQPAGVDPASECPRRRGAAAASCSKRLREQALVHIDADPTADPASVKEAVAAALHSAARATNLLRIARDQATSPTAQRLAVSIETKGAGRAAGTAEGGARVVPQGAELTITVRHEGTASAGGRALDVTAFWVDSKFGVELLWPQGELNRLLPGQNHTFEVGVHAGAEATAGLERLVVIAVEAETHMPQQNLGFLAQPSPRFDSAGVRTRGAADVFEYFADAGFADFRTRGSVPSATPGGVGIRVVPLRIRP